MAAARKLLTIVYYTLKNKATNDEEPRWSSPKRSCKSLSKKRVLRFAQDDKSIF